MRAGRLIAVVGPSGVGKDSVMAGLVRDCGLAPVRRVITRPAEAGGEAHEAVSEAEFARRRDRGDFVLHWQAHGLCYGIPATLRDDLAQGRDLLANLSRGVLGQAAQVLPGLVVLRLTARPDTLAARLGARGRESAEDIAARLAREGGALPDGVTVVTIANDGPLAQTVAAARAALYPANA